MTATTTTRHISFKERSFPARPYPAPTSAAYSCPRAMPRRSMLIADYELVSNGSIGEVFTPEFQGTTLRFAFSGHDLAAMMPENGKCGSNQCPSLWLRKFGFNGMISLVHDDYEDYLLLYDEALLVGEFVGFAWGSKISPYPPNSPSVSPRILKPCQCDHVLMTIHRPLGLDQLLLTESSHDTLDLFLSASDKTLNDVIC